MNFFTSHLRDRWQELHIEWRAARRHHPVLSVSLVSGFAVAAVAPVVLTLWFLFDLRSNLPDQDAVQRIGQMDQATTVYDSSDTVAFTIFREQRIDVPLSAVSPNLVQALIAIED